VAPAGQNQRTEPEKRWTAGPWRIGGCGAAIACLAVAGATTVTSRPGLFQIHDRKAYHLGCCTAAVTIEKWPI